jgi:CYTH domain-containing protein
LRHPIEKTRICFEYANQYCELDVFKNVPGLILLEIELTSMQDTFVIPPFLGSVTDVTDDSHYSNEVISHELGKAHERA